MKLLKINEVNSDLEEQIKQDYKLQLPVITILDIVHHKIKKQEDALEIVLTNGDTITIYEDGVNMSVTKYKYTNEYFDEVSKTNNKYKAALNLYEKHIEQNARNAKFKINK